MDNLIEKHWNRVNNTDLKFVRSIFYTLDWNERLIGIKGARGVGKTTLLLQYIKFNQQSDNTFLYASLDNLWFTENHLMSLVDTFVKQGGQHLFLVLFKIFSDRLRVDFIRQFKNRRTGLFAIATSEALIRINLYILDHL